MAADGELYQPILVACTIALVVAYFLRSLSSYQHLPPGPPRGFFSLAGTSIPPYSWRFFESLTHKYGPVCTVWLGKKPLIVVGSYEAAVELLEKKASSTADRPRSVMAGEIMSGEKRILLVGQGERWKRLRKMLHQGLQPVKAASYEPIQEAAARTMLLDVLEEPDHFQDHAKKYAASVIMSITYGKTTPTQYSDPEVMAINVCGARLGGANRPGAYLADSYPFLKYLPGKWKSQGQKWHQEELALFAGQMDEVRRSVGGQDCVGKYMIEHQTEYNLEDDEVAYLGGSMFGAGSDTTASTIAVSIMAASLYPEAVTNAQREIDRVVGQARPPSMNDLEDLPYVQAYVREVFRWRPVSVGGFRHQTTEPITYQQYVIPSGTAIVGNHWSIGRDPKVFPEPEVFRPERWLTDAETPTLRKDIFHYGYGFGRRVCPGRHVADRSTFLTISGLLWAFKFGKKVDFKGREIDIDTLAFTDTANTHPHPFSSSITPRFAGVRKVLTDLALT